MPYTLSRSQVHRHAAHLLQTHLHLTDFRSRCPARMLLDLLLAAASWLTSLYAACLRLLRAPSPETARLALLAWLPARGRAGATPKAPLWPTACRVGCAAAGSGWPSTSPWSPTTPCPSLPPPFAPPARP